MDQKQVAQNLKNAIGLWMFEIMSRMTKEQFIIILQNYQTDPSMGNIKKIFDEIKKKYKGLCSLSTDRQLPYVGKPFFHGIKFSEAQECPEQSGYVNILSVELNDFSTQRADVTSTIRNIKEFSSFATAVQSLFYQDEFQSIRQTYTSEFGDAITKALEGAVNHQQAQSVLLKRGTQEIPPQKDQEESKEALGCSVKLNFKEQSDEDLEDNETSDKQKALKQKNIKEAFKKVDEVMGKLSKKR